MIRGGVLLRHRLAVGVAAVGRGVDRVSVVLAGGAGEGLAHGGVHLFRVVLVVAADEVDLGGLVVLCPGEGGELPIMIRGGVFLRHGLAVGVGAVGRGVDRVSVVLAGGTGEGFAHGGVDLGGMVFVVAADEVDLGGLVILCPCEGDELPIMIRSGVFLRHGLAVGVVAVGRGIDCVSVVLAGGAGEGFAHAGVDLGGMVFVVAADKVDLCGLVILCPGEGDELPIMIYSRADMDQLGGLGIGLTVVLHRGGVKRVAVVLAVRINLTVRHRHLRGDGMVAHVALKGGGDVVALCPVAPDGFAGVGVGRRAAVLIAAVDALKGVAAVAVIPGFAGVAVGKLGVGNFQISRFIVAAGALVGRRGVGKAGRRGSRAHIDREVVAVHIVIVGLIGRCAGFAAILTGVIAGPLLNAGAGGRHNAGAHSVAVAVHVVGLGVFVAADGAEFTLGAGRGAAGAGLGANGHSDSVVDLAGVDGDLGAAVAEGEIVIRVAGLGRAADLHVDAVRQVIAGLGRHGDGDRVRAGGFCRDRSGVGAGDHVVFVLEPVGVKGDGLVFAELIVELVIRVEGAVRVDELRPFAVRFGEIAHEGIAEAGGRRDLVARKIRCAGSIAEVGIVRGLLIFIVDVVRAAGAAGLLIQGDGDGVGRPLALQCHRAALAREGRTRGVVRAGAPCADVRCRLPAGEVIADFGCGRGVHGAGAVNVVGFGIRDRAGVAGDGVAEGIDRLPVGVQFAGREIGNMCRGAVRIIILRALRRSFGIRHGIITVEIIARTCRRRDRRHCRTDFCGLNGRSRSSRS